MIIPQDNIFIGCPTIDRRVDCETSIGISGAIREYGGKYEYGMGYSDLLLSRNLLTQKFLESPYEWFVMWDSDVIASPEDFKLLWDSDTDIATAPYARKIPGKEPALFGLGFTRVHRRVFEAINQLTNDDGEVAQRFYMDGQIFTHFYPAGVTGDSRWLGEDRAFFVLCSMTGTNYTLETRCRLQHAGNFLYGYPDQINGAEFWRPEGFLSDDTYKEEGDDRPIVVM